MRILFFLLFITAGAVAQPPAAPSNLKTLATRGWIRLEWTDRSSDEQGFKVYWSEQNHKPLNPGATIDGGKQRYYIQGLKEEIPYYVWLEAYNKAGSSKALSAKVITTKQWQLDKDELRNLDIASSGAVPAGMEIFWNDEFNDDLLNRNKWSTNYYSNIDYLKKDNLSLMQQDSLPQPGMTFNGHSINLFTNDSVPLKSFYPESGRKISSIQTYDWRTNENYLDNSHGGYFEVRVKRSSTGNSKGINTAYWFDSPGPDLKNYLQQGTILDGVKGIRPKGQVFEIDVFENLDAQFVLHGHVDEHGAFLHNLATDIAEGFTHVDQWVTHGILWTPSSIKHYINGKLIKSYDNKNQIYSPNHFMNVFLGSYGAGGQVNMEVDYIRAYNWRLENGNELPNPGFEANTTLLPWEGNGTLTAASARKGQYGLLLKPGQSIEQYVYLNNSKDYELTYWVKGKGKLKATVDNLKQVSGDVEQSKDQTITGKSDYTEQRLKFQTGKEYGDYMKTVRVKFANTGDTDLNMDDIEIRKK
jgi:hypothetical protein